MNDDTLTHVPEPFPVPIGLRLNQAARAVERAFDDALAEAGGTLPIWLVLLNLKIRKPGNQRELAEAGGVREIYLEGLRLPLVKLLKRGVTDLLRISDARMSGTSYGAVVLHVAPESAVNRHGGPPPIFAT